MSSSPRLALPYIIASQAQKEVTHNDALNDLDSLAQISVITMTLSTPPASPSEGDSYIVGPSPTGAWAGAAGCVASYYSGWRIKTPKEGWNAWVQDVDLRYFYNGTSWVTPPISMPAGSVSAPGLPFASDTNTGLYNPAADTLGIAAGGVDSARFKTAASAVNYLTLTPSATTAAVQLGADGSDSNIGIAISPKGTGKVGIGTTSPNHKLDVNGNIGVAVSSYFNFGSSDGSSGYGLRDNAGTMEYKNSGGSWAAISSGGSSSFPAGTVGSPGWPVTGDTDTGLYEPAANTLSICAGGIESARFNTASSAVNYPTLTPSATTAAVVLGSGGSDTNIGITITPKGTGSVTLSNLNSSGVVTTNSSGVLATNAQLPAAQFPALSGDITTSAGSLATSIGAGKVTNAMLAGSIAASKLTGTDIATVGTITSGTWNGTAIDATHGGTAQTGWTLGDLLYSSASNTLSKLAGNTTSTKKYLSQTGTGSVSAAPAWAQIAASDLSNGVTGSGNVVLAASPSVTGLSTDTISASGAATFSSTVATAAALSDPQGRLTLTSGTAVLTSSVSAATTIYYTPYQGRIVPIYDGTNFLMTDTGGEISNVTSNSSTGKAGPAAVTTNSNYDLFVWNDSGTIRLTRGPAWSSDTSRGTGAGTTELLLQNGIYLNKQSITNGPAASRGTYVGTVRSNGTSTIDYIFGATASGGTAGFFGVWNAYNRVSLGTQVADSTASWSYTTATLRAANASNTMRVSFVRGLDEDCAYAYYQIPVSANAAAIQSGVCLDATNSISGVAGAVVPTTSIRMIACGVYNALPGLGFHYLQAVEAGGTSGTFYANTNGQAGMIVNLRA